MREDSRLDGNAGAALGTTRVDHCAATRGLHAHAESVSFLTPGIGGLISAFHDFFLNDQNRVKPHIVPNFQGFSQGFRGRAQ